MENKLATGKISALLVSLAVPAMLAQVISLLYNIVDRVYIGHIADGSLAITAIGISMPVMIIIFSVCNLFGRGGAPLSGINLGAGKGAQADHIMANSLFLLLASSALLMVAILLFCKPLLLLFGASELTLPYAASYLRICSLGIPFLLCGIGLNYFINTQGFTKIGMITTLIGAVANIILDPVFIFVLDMGISGAAIATVISQIFSFLWVVRFYRGPLAMLRIRPEFMAPRWKYVKAILMLGSAPAFMTSTEGILLLCFNTQLYRFGGDLAVGAMTILATLFQLVFLPMIGIYQGAQPIVSFNYGSGDFRRVKEAIWLAGGATLGYSLICTFLIAAFPAFFINLFTQDQALLEQTIPMLRIYISGCFFLGLNVVSQDSYNALGDGKLALFFAVLRKGILLIPLIYLLPMLPVFEGSSIDAVVFAEPVSDITSSIACTTWFIYYVKKKLTRRAAA